MSAIFVEGSGTYTVLQTGIDQYLVEIYPNAGTNSIHIGTSNVSVEDSSINSLSMTITN